VPGRSNIVGATTEEGPTPRSVVAPARGVVAPTRMAWATTRAAASASAAGEGAAWDKGAGAAAACVCGSCREKQRSGTRGHRGGCGCVGGDFFYQTGGSIL
jgi:hypothetical protein